MSSKSNMFVYLSNLSVKFDPDNENIINLYRYKFSFITGSVSFHTYEQ